MQMDQIFRPLTSSPFRRDDTYTEILPCEALRPYICCFWGTSQPLQTCDAACESLVTPDTCMDILIDLDYTRQSLSSRFVAIDDRAFLARGNGTGHLVATFAVRFYAWAVPLFSDESMVQVQNGFFNADRFFPALTRQLEAMLPCVDSLEERVRFAQQYLLETLRERRKKPAVMNAIHSILKQEGRAALSEAAAYACVSPRQLERLFGELVGVSPKKFAGLVRYQQVWRACCSSGISMCRMRCTALGLPINPICCGILSDFIRSRLRRRGHMRSVSVGCGKYVAFLQSVCFSLG